MNFLYMIPLVMSWPLWAAEKQVDEEVKKPNVLFIFADDLSYETLGCSGKTICKTPHLDQLAHRGTSFTSAYNMGAWGGAVCMASRAMLNSGLSVNRAEEGIKTHPHWSEMMKAAGYRTYMTGKWHVPGQPKFDVVKNVRGGMPKQTPEGYNRPHSPEDHEKGWKPWDKSKGGHWEGGTHWGEIVVNNTKEFLEKAKSEAQPFFMYVAFNSPHDPRQSPKSYIDMYPLESIKVPENFHPNYPYDKDIGCDPAKLRDERLMPTPRTTYSVKVHLQEYYALVTYMDHQIGLILAELEKSGLAHNTMIIFTADNGLSVGHHGLVGKQSMYDHSMKVPFILAGPGITSGEKCDVPIYLQDAMPTALNWANYPIPSYVEFKSLLPLVKKEKSQQYPCIYGKYMNYQRMIRKGDFKLIMYPEIQKMLLFNVKNDPEEMRDLAPNPEYASKVAALIQDFKALQKDMVDTLDLDHPVKTIDTYDE